MSKKSRLRILGMHCPSCAVNIKKAIESVEGVRDVELSFSEQTARLIVEKKDAFPLILRKIRELGYDVLSEKIVVSLDGLRTPDDETKINSLIRRADGILDVLADALSGTVYII